MRSCSFLPRLIVCAAAFSLAGSVMAATISVDTNNSSGRIGDDSLDGVDWQFGTADAETAATGDLVAYNNSLLGDNPSNEKFGQLWRFDITSDFATDLTNGYEVRLQFTSGLINNGGGAPSPVEIHFLTAGTGKVREDAALATPTSLGSISASAQNTFYDIQVTGLPGGLAAGDRIWIGLEADLSSNGSANNIFIAGTGSTINAQLATVIPEPGTLALVTTAMAGLALILWRRRV